MLHLLRPPSVMISRLAQVPTTLQLLGQGQAVPPLAGKVGPALASRVLAGVGTPPVGKGVDGNSAPGVKDAEHLDVAGLHRRDQIIEDDVDHILMEVPPVAKPVQIKFERLGFDHLRIPDIADVDRGPVGLSGDRTEAGELQTFEERPVVALRMAVVEDFQNIAGILGRVGGGCAERLETVGVAVGQWFRFRHDLSRKRWSVPGHSNKNPQFPQRAITLSVIVPVLNEAEGLAVLFATLGRQTGIDFELLLCDGGSDDGTPLLAQQLTAIAPFPCRILETARGRAMQLNAGAAVAIGDWFLFLHADSCFEADDALATGVTALRQAGAQHGPPWMAGHFALRFARRDPKPSFPYYFWECKARLNRPGCIHGDQGFLLSRSCFAQVGPFDPSLPFLEDDRLAAQVFAQGEWLLLPAQIVTSARRFEREGLYRRQLLNAVILTLAALGRDELLRTLPGLYVRPDQRGRLPLKPLVAQLHRSFKALSPLERRQQWRAAGHYARANLWQLGLLLDTRRNFRHGLPPGIGATSWVDRFARWPSLTLVATLLDRLAGLWLRLGFWSLRRFIWLTSGC